MTLAWIDPPNAFNARKQLLHDLDLLVLDQGGHTLYHPNGLPGPDEKNNVEKVFIKKPKPQVCHHLLDDRRRGMCSSNITKYRIMVEHQI